MKEQIIRFEEIYINDKVGSNNYRPITEAKIIGDLIRCKDCRWDAGEGMHCANNIMVQFDHFFCYYGEREEDE